MLTVEEAANELNVSPQRVRAMLAAGQLEGHKHGRAWMLSTHSVRQRKQAHPRSGRPKQTAPAAQTTSRHLPDIEAAHRLFDEAQSVLAGCYHAEFLDQARSPEEQEFWIRTADLLLQQKQRTLIEQGVY